MINSSPNSGLNFGPISDYRFRALIDASNQKDLKLFKQILPEFKIDEFDYKSSNLDSKINELFCKGSDDAIKVFIEDKKLLEKNLNVSPLRMAIDNDRGAIVEFLIREKNVDPNNFEKEINGGKDKPIRYAFDKNKTSCIKALLECDCDISGIFGYINNKNDEKDFKINNFFSIIFGLDNQAPVDEFKRQIEMEFKNALSSKNEPSKNLKNFLSKLNPSNLTFQKSLIRAENLDIIISKCSTKTVTHSQKQILFFKNILNNPSQDSRLLVQGLIKNPAKIDFIEDVFNFLAKKQHPEIVKTLECLSNPETLEKIKNFFSVNKAINQLKINEQNQVLSDKDLSFKNLSNEIIVIIPTYFLTSPLLENLRFDLSKILIKHFCKPSSTISGVSIQKTRETSRARSI
ncbi:MAG: ankyrin repeat domain-containing protein [Alphaproteobacteria bacterium]|nr:ankyrin repeat domain-containing protein [Alphaproteobacteria bacterium]